METAIHFSTQSLASSFETLKNSPAPKKVSAAQKKLARLASNTDWKAVVSVINDNIDYLRSTLRFNPKNDTVESYGFRCMAAELVINYLERVRDLPERYKLLKDNGQE